MCDYSLHDVPSRPAKVGDRLTTTRFRNAITRGFADPNEPRMAVCLLPGTELAFDEVVRCDPPLPLFPKWKSQHKVARFRQVNLDRPATHHDALEFPDGKIKLLTNLERGPAGDGAAAAKHRTRRRERARDAATPAVGRFEGIGGGSLSRPPILARACR